MLAVHVLQVPLLDHKPTSGDHLRRVLAVDGVLLGALATLEVALQRSQQTAALNFRGQHRPPILTWGARQVGEGGKKINQGHVVRHLARRAEAKSLRQLGLGVEEERHARRPLVECLLEPHAPLAQHVAVVGGYNDKRVFPQAFLVQGGEHLRDLTVDVAHHAVVGPTRFADALLGHLEITVVHAIVHPRGVMIPLIPRNERNGGHVDLDALVLVPKLLRAAVRVVGLCEGSMHEERALLHRTLPAVHPCRAASGKLPELSLHLEGDVFIEVELHAGVHPISLGHRHESLEKQRVPLACGLLVPIGRPAEVCRVYVCGQTLLKPVQLVGTNEVHLAAQNRVVALAAQQVCVGRDVTRELCGVVPSPDLSGKLPTHHREARRRAEGRGCVGVGEDHGLLHELVDGGRLRDLVAVVAKSLGGELVELNQQDVGQRTLNHRDKTWWARRPMRLFARQGGLPEASVD
mmetsp:Transcript_125600/g.401637  ORF Transcript_125600/g.401637 Transcript_125600/m.401637 type:complete len:463 (+) Transcript_125600:976-2364(+)